MTTVASLIRTFTDDEIKAKLLGYLQAAKAPVTDWNSGSFLLTLARQWKLALLDFVGPAAPVPTLRETMLGVAFPILPGIPSAVASASLSVVCEQTFDTARNYELDGTQFANTFTVQSVTLTCDASHGPYSITPGSHYLRSPTTGNRYVSNETKTACSIPFVCLWRPCTLRRNAGATFASHTRPGSVAS